MTGKVNRAGVPTPRATGRRSHALAFALLPESIVVSLKDVGRVAAAWLTVGTLAAPGWAAPAASRPVPVVLREVALSNAGAGEVWLRVSRPAEAVTRTLPAVEGRPPRVYVDLPGTVLGPRVRRELAGSGDVRAVRVGQFDPTTARVVLELGAPKTATVDREGNVLTIHLGAAGDPSAAPTPPVVDESAPPRALAPLPVTRRFGASEDEVVPAARVAAPSPRGPVSDAVAELRREVSVRRVSGDRAGVVASYAAHGAAVASRLDAPTRAAIADSLREVGLVEEAGRVLGDERPGEATVLRIARAELALASGDTAAARRVARGLADTPPSGMVAEPLARLRARVALADGDLETARRITETWPDPALVGDVARAALAAGRAAAAARSWDRAQAAYETVLAGDVDGATRAAAAAGLARVTLARGDRESALRALDTLATMGTPLLRRAAAALAADADLRLGPAAQWTIEDDRESDR